MESKKIELLMNFLNEWNDSFMIFNTNLAKFYCATFYSLNKWYGSFEYFEDETTKWEYVIDLKDRKVKKNVIIKV